MSEVKHELNVYDILWNVRNYEEIKKELKQISLSFGIIAIVISVITRCPYVGVLIFSFVVGVAMLLKIEDIIVGRLAMKDMKSLNMVLQSVPGVYRFHLLDETVVVDRGSRIIVEELPLRSLVYPEVKYMKVRIY